MWWIIFALFAFGMLAGFSSPSRAREPYPENEYDYDGGSGDCGDCDGGYDGGGE